LEVLVTLFDLWFLACALATAATLVMAAGVAIRGQGRRAGSILKRLGIAAIAYLVLGLIVSAALPQRVLSVGDPWCFDDWCLSVDGVNRVDGQPDVAYRVSLTIFSRARRVSQRAKGAWIYLIDSRDRRYEPLQDPEAVALDVLLQPGESVKTLRTFRVPASMSGLGLIAGHGRPYCSWFPLIIGEGGCAFHKPTMVRIE
jgi:hypothetical protein